MVTENLIQKSPIFCLNPVTVNMLFQDHLGHNPDISEKSYRKSLPLVELTKVAKALVIAEQGRLLDYKGKSFDELTSQDAEPKEDDEDIDDIEEDDESAEEFQEPPPK